MPTWIYIAGVFAVGGFALYAVLSRLRDAILDRRATLEEQARIAKAESDEALLVQGIFRGIFDPLGIVF